LQYLEETLKRVGPLSRLSIISKEDSSQRGSIVSECKK
jgi:hypothetical protein